MSVIYNKCILHSIKNYTLSFEPKVVSIRIVYDGMVYQVPKMVFFYDSYCPLCNAEVRQLTKYDHARNIRFVDIHDQQQLQRYPMIDPVKANAKMHLLDDQGELHIGLDATCLAWNQVGRHRWLTLLRLPLIKPIADCGYLFFARHRYSISYLLTGKKRCDRCRL